MTRRLAIIAVAITTLALSACNATHPIAPTAPIPKGVDMVVSDGVRYLEAREGILVWDIKSTAASYSMASGVLDFNKADAIYYEAGKETYRASGGDGHYDSKKEILNLSGDVDGKSTSGYSIKTDHIEYNMKTKIAETDSPVVVSGQGLEIKGVGLIADFGNRTFSILDGASIFVEPAKIHK